MAWIKRRLVLSPPIHVLSRGIPPRLLARRLYHPTDSNSNSKSQNGLLRILFHDFTVYGQSDK